MKQEGNIFDTIVAVLLAAIGVLALRAIFDNDNTSIVSKEGRRILEDKDRMDKINKQIADSQTNNPYNEILIQ